MQKRTWLLIGLGALVIAVAGFMLFGRSEDKPVYRLDRVSRGDISLAITATGTLNADTTVQVGSQVSGRISQLFADYNSNVKKGQLLAEIDPTFLQAAVQQQKAGLEKARAQMDDAKRTLDRTTALYKRNLAAQADMDVATTTYQSNKASFLQAQAALNQAEVNLRYTSIRAPISGVVISRSVDVGQTVAASLQAPTLFTIANDLRKMQVQASVDEADIGNVKIGQAVTFRVDAFPNRVYKGTVRQVRLAPVVSQNVVTYTVIIGVSNEDLSLMPGMTATVSILVAQRNDALRVPIQAVRFTPPNERGENVPRQAVGRPGGRAAPGSRAQGGAARGADSLAAGRQNPQGEGNAMMRTGPDSSENGNQDGRGANRARVWVLQENKPVPVTITEGLQNNQYVEVVEGNLQEGENVVVGMESTATRQAPAGQNPFQPRFGGRGR